MKRMRITRAKVRETIAEVWRQSVALYVDQALRDYAEAEALPHVRRRLDEIREEMVESLLHEEQP